MPLFCLLPLQRLCVQSGYKDASLCCSLSLVYPGVKSPTMSFRSYFTVKQHDVSELEKLSSSVAQAVKTAETAPDKYATASANQGIVNSQSRTVPLLF